MTGTRCDRHPRHSSTTLVPVRHGRAVLPRPATAAARRTDTGRLAHLLVRSARGDDTAFTELYGATSAWVFGLVLRVVRDRAQSEEVTQDVFTEIWSTASRFDATQGTALAWLMTIAHRRGVDKVRRAEAARGRESRYHHSHRPVAHDQTAEAGQAAIDSAAVRDALTALTTLQREAVELAYLRGHTYSEVAVLLDLPATTTKSRIRDGLLRMRAVLAPVYGSGCVPRPDRATGPARWDAPRPH